ncbi:ribonuclease III [Treponema sp. OMZ 840]|uniref:ribonuclease III n=1 Tax=Treponema sp. OMZ 840 TaxID=244313 RepID=UPI003D91A791
MSGFRCVPTYVRSFFKTNKTISSRRKPLLNDFQKRLGIKFKDIQLLDTAFYHRSFSNEISGIAENNERLEFLGDAVLGMVTAAYLYKSLAEHPEGELTKIKSFVVSETSLSEIALSIGVEQCLCLGKGEELSGGRGKKAILADAMEAVFGAYYLDSGFKAVEKLILDLLIPQIQKVKENRHEKDYKTLLQEFYQKKYKQCPHYELVKKSGPDHEQIFWISVFLGDKVYGPKQGKSKKEAEQAAARYAWEHLRESGEGQSQK